MESRNLEENSMWKALAAGTAVLGAGLYLRSEYEKRHFAVEELSIASPKLIREHRFVFITDVHDKEFGPGNRMLLQAIRKVKPEGILIGGDMMVSREESGQSDALLEKTFVLLKGLVSIAPVYYSLGNHEMRLGAEREVYGDSYDRLLKGAGELGVHMLVNRQTLLGQDLAVAGVNLPSVFYRNLLFKKPYPISGEYLDRRLGEAQKERFQILMMHSPLYFKECREWGADLTLAGHFHGGTIRIPKLGGLMTPQYQFFLPWCAGNFYQDGRWMAVGRGLGTHSVNIRLNDRPQVLVICLRPQ